MTRRTVESRVLRAYVATVVATGLGVIAWCAYAAAAPEHQAVPWASLALFGALYLVAELFPIRVYSRTDAGSFTVSAAFAYALILSSPLPVALLVIPVGSIAGDLRNRRPAVRTAFNAAQQTIAFGVGGLIIQALLGRAHFGPLETVGLEHVLALLPSGGAMYVANIALTGAAIALNDHLPLREVMAEDFAPIDVLGHFMLLGLAPIFVVVTQRSVLLAPLLFLTVLAVYRSTQAALRRQHESLHDQLTGLKNRRYLDTRLAEISEEARSTERPFGVLVIDLDRFKEVNDTLGHHVGDLLLVAVADRLATLDGIDTIARLGGDEFALLVEHPCDLGALESLAAEVVRALETTFDVEDFPLQIGGSVGIAMFPTHGREVDQLLRRADAAMYTAKRSHSGFSLAVSDSESAHGPGRVTLLADLPGALERDELRLSFQPKTDTHSGVVIGFEALVRWSHPTLGPLEPSQFIPMVEHTELIGELTAYVLRSALAACRRWSRAGYTLPVAVNVSARDLQDLRFPELVDRCLEEAGLPACRLELEITENAIMADHGRVSQVLDALRGLGVTITIDDFGTGYSSLAHLRSLPVDAVKIDRTFVNGMATSDPDAVIVRSVVALAHGMGMRVVAEGVEDLTTLELLRDAGCDETQGFLVSRPLACGTVLEWLAAATGPAVHPAAPVAPVAPVVPVAPGAPSSVTPIRAVGT